MKNKIILVNGPAGVGKTTLAEQVHKNIPFSLKINIDNIKFCISDFRTNNSQAVSLAISTAIAMAKHYAEQGFSVVIDRMIWGGYKSIPRLQVICGELGIDFVHILVTANKDTVVRRAVNRGFDTEKEGGLNREKISKFFDKFKELPPENITMIVDSTEATPEQVWLQVKDAVLD